MKATAPPPPGPIAVCSWSLRPESPGHLAGLVERTGLHAVQLALNSHRGSSGGLATGRVLREHGIRIVSGMFGAIGEDYSTLESIRRTGGFVADGLWEENLALARIAADDAHALGIGLVSTHAGFLPEDPADPSYAKLAGRIGQIATVFADRGIRLALETGQEEAVHLDRFLRDLHPIRVGVNFDPANMILYGKGDPVAALAILLPHLDQVHIKDAIPAATPGEWGRETPAGQGAVDWPDFFSILSRAGYGGAYCIEREGGSGRIPDIRRAAELVGRFIHPNP